MLDGVKAGEATGAAGSEVVQEAAVAPAAQEGGAVAPAPLAELIADHRRSREAAKREAERAKSQEGRIAELEAELAKSKSARDNLLADPVGYLRSQGVEDGELPVVGEALLYHLVPEKAPPELRPRLIEAQLRRQDRQRQRDEAARAEREAAERNSAQFEVYRAALDAVARSSPPESAEFSRKWFGTDSQDEEEREAGRAEYVESLVHTARNMADEAQSRGEVADLRPQKVVEVLEGYLAKRARRVSGGGAAAVKSGAGASSAVKPGGVSSQELSESGTARPKALTEEERMARALEALERVRSSRG